MIASQEQLRKARRLVKSLHSQGNSRQAVVNAVVEACGISARSASVIASRSGLYEPICHNKNIYGQQEDAKAQAAWDSISINIDTGTHPYYRAARILDAKPGISAEVRDGVCYRNGHPWPAMKFLVEAGVELG